MKLNVPPKPFRDRRKFAFLPTVVKTAVGGTGTCTVWLETYEVRELLGSDGKYFEEARYALYPFC